MSKSLGNVVDPVDVIETHGTDALRFTLATGRTSACEHTMQLWQHQLIRLLVSLNGTASAPCSSGHPLLLATLAGPCAWGLCIT